MNGPFGVGIVGAEIAGLDSVDEVMAERGNGFPDFLDGILDPFGDGAARAFGFG